MAIPRGCVSPCRFRQVFTNNMAAKSQPIIKTCKASENWTCVTFKPDLSKFGMSELEDDTIALMRKRVYDLAGVLGKGVKVEHSLPSISDCAAAPADPSLLLSWPMLYYIIYLPLSWVSSTSLHASHDMRNELWLFSETSSRSLAGSERSGSKAAQSKASSMVILYSACLMPKASFYW